MPRELHWNGAQMSDVVEASVAEAAAQAEVGGDGVRLLPFSFARRFGAAITNAEPGANGVDVVCREPPSLATLGRSGALPAGPCGCGWWIAAEFEQVLNAAYARGRLEARQMVEDLGDELDLASLADAGARDRKICSIKRTMRPSFG